MAQARELLDRSAPGPAQQSEVMVYLTKLIDWLNTDPWPRDRRFGGPVLTPAAIERQLRILAPGKLGENDHDADLLAMHCRRLVILGGPGSGKTWLAKRTVRRCAEEALTALRVGRDVDEIELPLFTTCSRLFATGGDIRSAAVSSALDQLGDLGSSRLNLALGRLFTERNAPVVLVIDSLDEASGSDERLRQADTLPWRVVLTSRPSSWNNQLVIRDEKDSHQVGDLLPLRYPDDVESFINRWFDQRPDRSGDLRAQIAQRPDLQQAATVPLILTFYCLLADQRLPQFRHDVHAKVLNRMLTSRWRDSRERRLDTRTCLRTLRTWAWSGASCDPVSGIGTWQNHILTDPSQINDAENDAVEHVATSLGPPDVDTGKVLRRFIHRSMREHLVAEHVASLPVDQATEALLPHLWYDPDWEFSAPAAIAMHPRHDQLLQDLMRRAAKSGRLPEDLSVIDAGWEFRKLLARIASESNESDWSTEVARMIGRARVDLAMSGHVGELAGASSWTASNREVCKALLTLLNDDQVYADKARRLVTAVVQLALISDDRLQVLDALLQLLANSAYGDVAAELVSGILQLASTAEDKRDTRHAVVELLASETDGFSASQLADRLIQLNPSTQEQLRARERLLSLIVSEEFFWVTEYLVDRIVQLVPTGDDRQQARDTILELLARQDDQSMIEPLVKGILQLVPTVGEKQQARDALLELLARQDDVFMVEPLVKGILQLVPTVGAKQQARDALLELLAKQDDSSVCAVLMCGMAQLILTPHEKHQLRDMLLHLLPDQSLGTVAEELVDRAIALTETIEERGQILDALLRLVISQFNWADPAIVNGIVQLDPTAGDKRRVREALLGFLARASDERVARAVVYSIVPLDPTAEDKRRARESLLFLLVDRPSRSDVGSIAELLTELDPTSDDKRSVRKALLGLLARETKERAGADLATKMMQLDPTSEDKSLARDALLALLARPDGDSFLSSMSLLDPLVQLASGGGDKRQLRQTLLRLLADRTSDMEAVTFVRSLAQLDPEPSDISSWRDWAFPPTAELLAAVRRTSPLETWLKALPMLAPLPH